MHYITIHTRVVTFFNSVEVLMSHNNTIHSTIKGVIANGNFYKSIINTDIYNHIKYKNNKENNLIEDLRFVLLIIVLWRAILGLFKFILNVELFLK